jgi:predicted transcriptional regulator
MALCMIEKNFHLEQLFGSKTRARLLSIFLQHPGEYFYVRELTRKIGAQLNSVRREIKNLIEIGLIFEKEQDSSQKIKEKNFKQQLSEKKKFYIANEKSLLFHDLKNLFKKVHILLKQNLVQEIEESGNIEYLAFTGRFVGNTSAPTDLMIVGSINQKSLQKVVMVFETELGHEINYTLMPKDEFLYRQQISDRFLCSIIDEPDAVVMINHFEKISSL